MEVKNARPREKWGQTTTLGLCVDRTGEAGLP
jgi:hypothetical protein